MTYPAAVVANELLRLGREEGILISPMKLQKLVYLTHGWHLAFLNKPLIGETIEAWQYGPVIPSLYRHFKSLRSAPITTDAPVSEFSPGLTAEGRELIKAVWDMYKEDSAIELSALTHETGSAWDTTRKSNEVISWNSPPIPDYLIQEEFKTRMRLQQVDRSA